MVRSAEMDLTKIIFSVLIQRERRVRKFISEIWVCGTII